MSIHWLRFIFIFTVCVLSAGTAYASDDCNAKLVGNRYYGAFVASFGSGKLTLEDLRKAVQHNEPYQPLADVTPDSKLGAAKRFFADIVRDPKVRAQWEETKLLLAALLQKQNATEELHQTAKQETVTVLAPKKIHSFAYEADQDLEIGELPNGDAVLAFPEVKNRDVTHIVFTSPEGNELHREKIPRANGYWLMGWHRDQNGKSWLYLIDRADQDAHIYRMDWDTKGFTEIVHNDGDVLQEAYGFQSVDNNYMLIGGKNKTIADLAEGQVKFTGLFGTVGIQQNLVVDANGKIQTRNSFSSTLHSHIIFKSTKGELYQIESPNRVVTVLTAKNPTMGTELASDMLTMSLLATETQDGNLLIAKAGYKVSQGKIEIFDPMHSKEPVLSVPSTPNHRRLHWFKGPRDELLLAADAVGNLIVVEPAAKTSFSIPLPGHIVGWLSSNKQTYFYVRDGKKIHIFTMTNEVSE